ncbi:MAG TPA: LysR family transcriptional regulator [Candidatus Dormibacteraeota bacterium]|nr:LysR family transcriptional regulator [Candidatus Dormibacteraeota bacterium]
MKFSQLRTFLETVRRGGFAEAARAMGVSQPAITRQIQRLENELGVRLLRRAEGPVTLTAAGSQVQVFAEQVLSEYEALRERLRPFHEGVAGSLRVAASTTPGEYLVPRLLVLFAQRYPEVTSLLDVSDSRRVADALAEGLYDVGFTGIAPQRPHLEVEQVATDEIVLIAPAAHPLAKRRRIKIADLEGETLIAREAGSGTMESVKRSLRDAGAELPSMRTAMQLGTSHAVLAAVRAGLGVGFVTSHALDGELHDRNGVRVVAINGVSLVRDLYMIYRADHLDVPVVRAFVDSTRRWAEGTRA